MYKRFRHIIMLIILLSGAFQALAQPFAMPDKVCVGTNRRYWVTDGLPGSFFTWKINGATQTSTVDFIDLSWINPGVFSLEVQEHQPNCDGDIQAGIVTVVDFPTLVINHPPSVCEPSTVDLSTSTITTGSDANLSFTYWIDAGGTNTLTNETAISVSGTYYIKATNTTGCWVIKPVNVIVNPQPILKITDPLAVCQPATIDLTAATVTTGSDVGLTYSYWADVSATTAMIDYTTVSATGTYYIKATNATGCSDIRPVKVIVNPLPKLVINDPPTVCLPVTVDLSAASVTASSDAGLSLTYWNDASGSIALANYTSVSVSGTYYIKATNANGCFVVKPVTVVVYSQPLAFAGPPETICPGSPYILSGATASNYSSLNWASSGDGAFDDPTLLHPSYTQGPNDLSSGTVTLSITAQGLGNGPGCVPVVSSVTLNIIKLDAKVAPSDVTCYGANNGTIIITELTGGSGIYQFRVDGFGWQSKSQYLDLGPGLYTIEMRDLLIPSCVRTLSPVTIKEPERLSATAEPQNATCLGNDGTISIVSPKGGSGSYEYSMNGGVWTTSGYFTGLIPGNYLIEMRDLNVPTCKESVGNVTIKMPAPVTASVSQKPVSCYSGNDGQILITDPLNGSGVYEFSIDGATWSSQMVFDNLTAGTYTVQMRDFNASICIQTIATLTITEPEQLQATISSTNITCFGSKDGTIKIQDTTGGSGSYEFTIDGSVWSGSTSYTNLGPGTYYVLMRDRNAPKCVVSFDAVEITEPLPLTALISKSDISCFGAHDGSIAISSPQNGTPGYQYTIDGSSWAATSTFTGLGTNTYTIQMRDSNGCKETIGTIFIIEPKPLTAVVDQTNATCLGNDGTITITNPENSVSGLYDFSIDGGSTWSSTGLFTGLASNTYTVKMRDANLLSCEKTIKTVIITEPEPLFATAVKTDVTCFGVSDGTISVKNPSGGSGLYQYSVDGATWTSTTTLAGLAPSTYTLQMRDEMANSCLFIVGDFVIIQPELLAATASPTDVTCYGGSDGFISLSGAKGGSGSYEYSIDGVNWFAGKINNLKAGMYTVQIRDAVVKSCVVVLGTVEIKEPEKIIADVKATPVTCFGASDGTITINNPQNGVPPYQYSLNGVAPWQTTNVFTGLKASIYDLIVISDANNCISTLAIVTITEPDQLEAKATSTNETSPGDNDGTITITGQKGGSGTFEYSKNGTVWQPGDVFAGLAPATYTILVRDANAIGCTIPLTVKILPAGSITAQYDLTPVTCFGGLDGSITFSNPKGAANYEYSINGTSWQTSPSFTGLAAQTYTLAVRDADNIANSTTLATIEITQPDQIEAVVTATSETFAGAKDGAITISSPKGGSGAYDYSIDGTTWQTSAQFPGLTSGIYDVQVRDRNATACRISIQKVIQPAGELIADVTHANVLCNGTKTGNILISNASGATAIEFSIDGGTKWQVSSVFNGLSAGTYDVRIHDAGNKLNEVKLGKVTITEPLKLQAIFVSSSYVPPLCAGGSGSFTISATGGTPPYTGTGDFVLPSGASKGYVVSDKNGCTHTVNVSMPDPPKIVATAVLNPPKCFGENGTITISATGGTGALTGVKTYIVQAGKSYSFKVTDANGCSSNIISGIMPPSEILAVKITPITSLCIGGSATVTVSATGGTPPYLSGVGTFNLAEGIHKFTVADSGGCTASASINITVKDPPPIPIAVVSVQPNCIVPIGTIKVNSPLGVNYEYRLDGGVYTSVTTFDKLVPGSSHTVQVKDISIGCESVSGPVTVDPMPDLPVPIASVTQPGCIVSTGKIEVILPFGPNYRYSFDGGTYTSVTTIDKLVPGSSHTLMVKDLLTGCVSLPTPPIVIDLMPVNPPTPVAKVSVNPTCNNLNGTVEVTSPTGAKYEYTVAGKTQTSTVFVNLKTGTYTITARDTKSGCISNVGTVVVPAIPPSPVLSLVSFENPICYGETGTITLTMTNTKNGAYTISYLGGQFVDIPVSNGKAIVSAPAGTYSNIIVEVNGCTSDEIVNVTITQPSEIIITETITEIDLKSNKKGAINIAVSGGTPFSVANPYQFKWSNGPTTEDIKDLDEGTYNIVVTDKNGCTQQKTIRIPAPNYPPVARDDEFITGCSSASGQLYFDNGKGIDYDPELDPFFIDIAPIESPKHGTVTINADGTFIYNTTAGYDGIDGFRYAIYDKNHYQGDTATVIIHVASDFDGDGIPDVVDLDADADGILNVDEVVKGGNWKIADNDGDGHLNWLDIDADNDGIVDNVEAQKTAGYIAPSGKINKDGLDLSYDPAQGGTKIVPVDTDSTLADPDGIPDFLDADSDNDWVPDYIEGHDSDANGKPDRSISGKDSDADGLDDIFDIVVNGCNNGNATGSNSPLQDFDGDGMKDWRDDNDDDDEYPTRIEDLNADGDYSNDVIGHVGHPEYLWFGRDCELFIPDAFSPNDDNIHDYFQIYCIESYPNAKMYIFDQLGNKLFEKEHYGNVDFWKTADQAWWDGTTKNRSASVNGNKVTPGTYYYVIRLGNGEVKKSFVFVSY